jgi:hypothetical protein
MAPWWGPHGGGLVIEQRLSFVVETVVIGGEKELVHVQTMRSNGGRVTCATWTAR